MNRICPIDGEDVLIERHPSKIVLGFSLGGLLVALAAIIVIMVFTGVVFVVAYIAVAVVLLCVGWILVLSWRRTIFYVTTSRVKSCSGIVGTQEQELTFDDVQSVEVSRTFWGAIFGFGTIKIEASGQERDVIISNIQNPQEIAQKISSSSMQVKKPI